jgi:hypothetical protein
MSEREGVSFPSFPSPPPDEGNEIIAGQRSGNAARSLRSLRSAPKGAFFLRLPLNNCPPSHTEGNEGNEQGYPDAGGRIFVPHPLGNEQERGERGGERVW